MRALDLFCGAGGAGRGLLRVFDRVTGIDIEDQKNYPGEFRRLNVLKLDPYKIRNLYDFIWASPPCQFATTLRHAPNGKEHVNLIPQTRELLRATGLPYVIENVEGAKDHMINPVMLCGSMFNLGCKTKNGVWFQLRRRRLFEATFPIRPLSQNLKQPVIGVYGGHIRNRSSEYGGRGTVDFEGENRPNLAARALGVPLESMTMLEMSQAIPPVFAQHIALEFEASLTTRRK